MSTPALLPVLALLSGAACGLTFSEPPLLARLPLLLGAAMAVLAARRAWPTTFVASVVAAFFAGGVMLTAHAWQAAWQPSLRVAFDEEAAGADAVTGVMVGVLRADATVRDNLVSLAVTAKSFEPRSRVFGRREVASGSQRRQTIRGGVLLSVPGELVGTRVDQWRAGRTVRAPVRLRLPTRHQNPGGLDEARALARRGFTLVGGVKSGVLVDVVADGTRVSEAAAAARAFVRRKVAAHVAPWDPTSAAVVTAILIGDRAGLTVDVERSLQDAGTYHVIAISGGNIAILSALTLVMFRWGGLLGRTAMLTAIAAFLAFGQVVNSSPSVTRALGVAVLYFAARALDHRLAPLHGLTMAAGGVVTADPLTVVDPGFLLSFGATLGILAAAPAMRGLGGPTLWRTLVGMVWSTAAAEAVLLPIVAFFFGRITVAGLAMNFAAIPSMAVVQTAGMALLPVSLVSDTAADVVGWVAATAASVLVSSASLVEWVPMMAWRVAQPSPGAIVAYYGTAAVALTVWRRSASGVTYPRRTRHVAGIAAASVALWIAVEPWSMLRARGDGRLHVTFLDVGQGDSTLVRFPRGSTMLVDAGGERSDTYDVGDRVVTPALRYLGVRRLGTVALTHGDVDHAGGAEAVVREFSPFDIWEGVPVPRLQLLNALRDEAARHRSRWVRVQRDDVAFVDGVEVSVRHPGQPDWERQDPRNDDSIVIELRWGEVSIVLPGDIGSEIEQQIAARFAPARFRALKVPHHGSGSSSSRQFLERLQPAVAVVSAGRGNPFGHPQPLVLSRLREVGADVFRTDRDGAVTLDTNGHDLVVSSVAGRTCHVSDAAIRPRAREDSFRASSAPTLRCSSPSP